MSTAGVHAWLHVRGFALPIALILLVITTLLAIAGMSAATTGLAMDGNELARQSAFLAAESGIDATLAAAESSIAKVPRDGSRAEGAGPHITMSQSKVAITIRYVGASSLVPGYSVSRFLGHHYEVSSRATGPRMAAAEITAGVMLIEPWNAWRP